MSKISTYEVAPVPKLSDKLIGTSVGGEIEDVTYNFTLQELLDVFLPVIPANNLQGILDYGNTATQDINLFGTITTTNLDVTDTANLFITYLNEETHLVGSLFDSADSVGTAGQVLTSTGDGVEWFTLPPIFTPNLEQVLTEGNTSSIDILLDANIEALDISVDTATISTNINIDGTITDNNSAVGSSGQVLSSTSTGVQWINFPVYSATSPLLFNSTTNVFSIQVASSTQGGYLSSSDWITFNGKQNAGSYITALTGEATATGPGSVPITLNNASVISKVLTGLSITGGSISASDSILTAFGKVQSQINGLMGGVQYQGVWNAATNTPTLTSSIGTQGYYYIVNVDGNTNLNGITDWKIGDWAIFSGGVWQKVDNTESVTSVNGQTGAVSLTTDNIPEGTTNLYYLNSRARAALSFTAGSGAYNNLTGVITIPTNTNQLTNGASFITRTSLSATSPLSYNNTTGVFSIPQATSSVNGYLSSTDWTTFNNKQSLLNGTGLVKSTAGTITYITDNSANWNTAYNNMIVSAAVTGTTTKTLTLTEQDGGTITASWTDLDTGLTSVGVSMPSAFTVTNSPLTANGTIGITGSGTNLQYIDGTGALQTFPGLTGFIPYTGATQNVDLGEFGISAGYFQADLTPTGALQVGRMQWNTTDGTMDLRLLGNNVTLQIGQENVTRVVNKSGIDLLEANYQVVRVRKVAEGGAQGQRLAAVLAQGNNENNSTEVIGIVTETINANQEGFVTAFGEVKNINTTGSLQGETWVDGDILYLSDTVPGQLTKVRPIAPNHAVIVGYVTYAHVNNGKIYLAIDTGYELGELHNVYAPSPSANQSIYWNSTNSRYELNTIGGILGYTPANAATLISTTAPLQGGGDLSANRTFSITQASASTDGYLSSVDWNTFNNKQPAGSYVPTSRTLSINGTSFDLSANRTWNVGTVTSVAALTIGTTGTNITSTVATGTTTPVITLNVPTASATNRGALSSADWTTFNNKVGGVTATSPLFSSGGSTPNITIQVASGSQNGYLSSTDWTTFNNKQAAGNYITSLTGEATASGPGAAAVTLNNASVTGKILTGVNITGGSISATDSILTAFGKVQNQINGLIGGSIYQGTWNASTNTPALASGVGTKGYYYIVSVAGTTNLDGITDWNVGDWAIFDGTAWQQVDNTDAVVSVNGQTGAVSLTTDNIPEGTTNLYFTDSRSRSALSFAAGSGAYNSTTGVITIPTNTSQLTNGANFITLASLSGTAPIQYNNTTGTISITQAGTASNGFLSSTDWNTFNNKQGALTLTTTGTSGAATLIGNTLNIPQYQTVLTNPVTGTGTTNYLSKWTASGTIGNGNVFDNGNGVIIGGTTALIQAGTTYLSIQNNTLTNSRGIAFYCNDGTQNPRAWIRHNTDGGNQYLAFDSTFSTAIQFANFAFLNGDVLINTTTDSGYKLDVNGTSRFVENSIFDASIGIGTTSLTNYGIRISKNITGAASGYGVSVDGTIQSDVTTARLNNTAVSTAASAFTLGSLQHYTAASLTIGAGSTVTNQFGFLVLATAIGATNNYAFSGQLAAATNTWNLYMNGTANNYLAGSLGIGRTSLSNMAFGIDKNITGGTVAYGTFIGSTIQSDVTSSAAYYVTSAQTAAASFTLNNLYHYLVSQSTIGAGSTVTSQYGYHVSSNMIGATNNYAFRSQIPAGTNRWNLFMDGTAINYLAGNTGIGNSPNFVSAGPILTTTLTDGGSGYVDGTYTDVASSNISSNGVYALFTIVVSSGIVTTATLTWGGTTYRAGDTITVSNTLLGGTGSGLVITVDTVDSSILTIASTTGSDITLYRNDTSSAVGENIGTIKWESRDSSFKSSGIGAEIGAFSAGTLGGAYLSFFTRSVNAGTSLVEAMRIDSRGGVGIGSITLTQYNLRVSKNITGATTSYGIASDGIIQSDVTSAAYYNRTLGSTQATTFTLGTLGHYMASQGTIGSGSTVTNQYGFMVLSTLIGATNNYGFWSDISAGANRWNLYMAGTATNYLNGNTGIGSTIPSGKLEVNVGSSAAYFTRTAGDNGSLNPALQIGTSASSPRIYSYGAALEFFTAEVGGTATEKMRLSDIGSFGIGTGASINASAKVQIDSTTQGFLPPRMTSAQRTAISSAATGLIVYQTDGVEGLWLNTSTGWRELTVV